jgi:hypothetical protein
MTLVIAATTGVRFWPTEVFYFSPHVDICKYYVSLKLEGDHPYIHSPVTVDQVIGIRCVSYEILYITPGEGWTANG